MMNTGRQAAVGKRVGTFNIVEYSSSVGAGRGFSHLPNHVAMSRAFQGFCRHYRNRKVYQVVGVARLLDSKVTFPSDKLAIYKSCYVDPGYNPQNLFWVRPLAMFKDNVSDANGNPVPRFEALKDAVVEEGTVYNLTQSVQGATPGLYKRFNNCKVFNVVGVARHTETEELYVVYQNYYVDLEDNPENLQWLEPLAQFTGSVVLSNGETIPRYKPHVETYTVLPTKQKH